MEDLRELSQRSRRTMRAGLAAVALALLLFPLALLVGASWALYPALGVAGLVTVGYAKIAGEERGAYRRIFRRLKDEKRTRRLVPDEPAQATSSLSGT